MPRPPKRAPTGALRSHLPERSTPGGAFTYHETQGFLFTVAASPEVVPPSEWVPIVFGGEVPALGQRAGRVMDELIEMYNDVVRQMSADRVRLPEDCSFRDDLLANLEPDAPVRQWSHGFLHGHNWLEEAWDVPVPEEFDQELGAVLLGLSFFSSRRFAEQAVVEFSNKKGKLVEMAELARRTFDDSMDGYAKLGDVLRRALVKAPPAPTPKVGRNEPCPCGSGKKYKRCCASAPQDLMERAARGVRRIQHEVEPKVYRFLHSLTGEDDLRRFRPRFACGDEDVEREGVEDALFFPWLLYDWAPETDDADGRSGARLYLERHGERLTPDERDFLSRTCATPTGFHEVLEVEPGRRLRLRDVILEAEHEVYERAASQTLVVGDVVYGRVVPYDGIALLIGMGEVALTPEQKIVVINIRTRLWKEAGPPAPATLKAVEGKLREAYLRLRGQRKNRDLPELTNTDGEPIELHTIRCDIESAQEAFDALATLAVGMSREELLEEAQLDESGNVSEIELPWFSRKKGTSTTDGRTVLGHIRIEGNRLTADVNSAGRSRRLLKSLRKRLGNSMRNLTVAIKSVDEAREDFERRRDTPEGRKEEEEAAAFRNRPETRQAMRELRTAQWEAWLDTEIPALDGMTPRDAVRDAVGREKVEALLMQFERRVGEDEEDGYDFGRLRRVLGLES